MFAFALVLASCGRPQAQDAAPAGAPAPLIAWSALFGDPVYASPKVSPDGRQLAYLAGHLGVLNVWVAPVANLSAARPVTHEEARGVRRYEWAPDSASVIYFEDNRGDENWRLFAAPITGGGARPLTPAGVRAELISLTQAEPAHALITLNERDRAWPDVYRLTLATGQRVRIERNANQLSGWVADRAGVLRLALRTMPGGDLEIRARAANGRWTKLSDIVSEDSEMSRLIGFEGDGAHVLMLDSFGRDTAALVRMDAATGLKTQLAESPDADIFDVWINPVTHTAEAFAVEFLRPEWRGLTEEARTELAALDSAMTDDPIVVSRSADNMVWTLEEAGPMLPTRSWIYDRRRPVGERLSRLFNHRPALDGLRLQPMLPREISARDGLTLVSYLTLPPNADGDDDGRPETPGPLVVLVHGGPWARDSYGFDPRHQWLANRGYAVLSVNFRGSTGFGKAFLNAGNLEWGRRMQDDLSDAVAWAVAEGVADPGRVAIMGASYGGYAALAGMAFTPDLYACGVSLMGPSNLGSLLNAIPPYWAAFRTALYTRVGDPNTPEGRMLLRERSPLFSAGAIRAPVLIGHGARDPRVPRAESDQMASALAAGGAGVTYLLYPDEGHGLARPANRSSWFATVEGFLGQCIGGRAEPIGRAFEGANVFGVRGADRVIGLAAVAPRPPVPASSATPAASASEVLPDTRVGVENETVQPPKDAPIVNPTSALNGA